MTEPPREIAAWVLLGCYGHIHTAELILGGMAPRDANAATASLYFDQFAPAYLMQTAAQVVTLRDAYQAVRASREILFDAAPAQSWAGSGQRLPAAGPAKHWTTRCMQASLTAEIRVLEMTWPAYVREFGVKPKATISAATAASLQWQTEMMWIFATGGGDLLASARVAHDAAAGRPRRKRKPADQHWLAGAIGETLDATWQAVLAAEQWTLQDGWQPFWRVEPLPRPERPYADEGR